MKSALAETVNCLVVSADKTGGDGKKGKIGVGRISLSPSDRAALERFAKGGESRLALRAKAVLALAEGASVSAAARELWLSRETVRESRNRFLESGVAGVAGAAFVSPVPRLPARVPRELAGKAGRAGRPPVADYSPSAKRPDWRRERQRLTEWFSSLPKPVGVFAAFDQMARHLLSVCRALEIPVPRQVQILGADDEDYLCENEIPPLSSLALDFRGAAESAMRAVFAHLEGGAPLPGTVLAGVAGLTERLSTCDNNRTGEWVNRARDVIRHHAAEGIGPSEVARRTGASLRLLEDAFKTVLGRTAAAELRETRLAEAARLLDETKIPPGELAARVGFGNPHSLMNAFRRRFGVSMGKWRKRAHQI